MNIFILYFDKGITMLILATDMARHGEIMDNFKMKLEPEFDYKNKDSLDTVYSRTVPCVNLGVFGVVSALFLFSILCLLFRL